MTHAPEPGGYLPERASNATWQWRFVPPPDPDAAAAPPRSPRFSSQSDAETWIGEEWRDLVDAGVDAVVLLDGERVVYGPMSLRPAGG